MNVVCAIILLLVYTVAMCIIGEKVPSSLSASVFDLPQRIRWIWTITLYMVCILVLFPFFGGTSFLDKVSENTQFLAFIAIVGLAFVGAAPLVKDTSDMAYKVHCGAAVVCAVCSQLVLAFNQPWLLLSWVPFIIAGFVIGWKKWRTMTFWAEMVCFFSTFAFCLI